MNICKPFIVVLAFLFPRLASKELVGTDISHAVMLHIAATLVYFNAGTIDWRLVGLLLLGSLPGVFPRQQAQQAHPTL